MIDSQIRIATEGLNVTVGGSLTATQKYTQAVLAHPCFADMKQEDFKVPGDRCILNVLFLFCVCDKREIKFC